MAVTYEKLPNEAITIITVSGSVDEGFLLPGPDEMDREILGIVEETPGHDYLIIDINDVQMSFSELVMVLGGVRREIKEMGGGAFVHTNITYLFVGSDDMAELAVKALGQDQYGHIEALLFPTVNEALAFAREQIRQEQGD